MKKKNNLIFESLFLLLTLYIGSTKSYANDNFFSSKSISSFGEVDAALVFDDKKSDVIGFYHLVNIERPNYPYHADCVIFLAGKKTGVNQYKIYAQDTKHPKNQPVSGVLRFEGSRSYSRSNIVEQDFSLKLQKHIPTCSENLDLSEETMQFSTNATTDFTSIAYIGSDKAYFYAIPEENAKKKSYLVKGDIAYVYEIKDNWLYVKYPSRTRVTEGWIRKLDIVDLSK